MTAPAAMASLFTRRSLLLPPAIRSSLFQTSRLQSRRHASNISTYEVPTVASELASTTSTTTGNVVGETLMAPPSLFLDLLHTTGLPWWAVLPMAAISVRGILIYRISTLPARRRTILRRNLAPIISARLLRKRMQGQFAVLPGAAVMAYFGELLRMSQAFKLSLFNLRSLFNLGVLIAFTEAIRVKCGGREGMLSLVTKPMSWLWSKMSSTKDAVPAAAQVQSLSPEEILAQRLFDAREAAQAQAATTPSTTDLASQTTSSPIELSPDTLRLATLQQNPYADFIEPTMRTEGLAWIPDLTLPDPTFTLPFLLTLTMSVGILLRSPSAVGPTPLTRTDRTTGTKFVEQRKEKPPYTLGQKIGLSFSLLFGIGATQFPAAVLLYLVPSMTVGWLQTRWLDVKHPIPGVVEPCRRPVRSKVRKEFDMPS